MPARLSPLRAALVAVAVLAGLFAMHGLTHHGEHLPTAHAAHAAAGHAGPDSPAADGSHHDGGGAMAMCLGVLLTGLLAWSGVRRPRRGVLLRLPPAAAVVLARPVTARSPDPPGPWSLSVCRC